MRVGKCSHNGEDFFYGRVDRLLHKAILGESLYSQHSLYLLEHKQTLVRATPILQ